MPKVSDQHRQERRRQILAAALRCFAGKGFHATSMADIIAESGLSAGAIYGHYASKNDLINSVAAEVFSPGRPEMGETFAELGPVMHPVDFAARLLNGVVTELGNTSIVVQVWGQAAVEDSMRVTFMGVYERLFARLRRQIVEWLQTERGVDTADAEDRADGLTRLLIGLAQGGLIQRTFITGFDLDAYLDAARPLFD